MFCRLGAFVCGFRRTTGRRGLVAGWRRGGTAAIDFAPIPRKTFRRRGHGDLKPQKPCNHDQMEYFFHAYLYRRGITDFLVRPHDYLSMLSFKSLDFKLLRPLDPILPFREILSRIRRNSVFPLLNFLIAKALDKELKPRG
jgi:hypothetical protein